MCPDLSWFVVGTEIVFTGWFGLEVNDLIFPNWVHTTMTTMTTMMVVGWRSFSGNAVLVGNGSRSSTHHDMEWK